MSKQFEQLRPLIEKYTEEAAKVFTRRVEWTNRIVPLAKEVFTNFMDFSKLPCYYGTENSLENQEAIFLAFQDERSGIHDKEKDENIIKQGGGLVFSQNANGKIAVHIVYPLIAEIKGDPGAMKDLGMFEPEQITEAMIISQIEQFFKEILQWECFYRETIGFNH